MIRFNLLNYGDTNIKIIERGNLGAEKSLKLISSQMKLKYSVFSNLTHCSMRYGGPVTRSLRPRETALGLASPCTTSQKQKFINHISMFFTSPQAIARRSTASIPKGIAFKAQG
jgi:hypothetical protein